jgi:hypothetical protein
MSIGTLSDIILKVRKLTGTGTSNQLTDSQIIDYINSFYLYDFPAQFRSLKLKDRYTFNTIRGIDTYAFDSEHFTTIEMPCYVAKREIKLFTDPWSFYGVNFNWQQQENSIQGDGSAGITDGDITGATKANPCVITSIGHDVVTGNEVTITDVVGMVELNDNTFIATFVDDDHFSLNVNSTLFTLYISGGIWTKPGYNYTVQATPLIRSYNNNPMTQTPTIPTAPYLPSPSPISFQQAIPGRVQNILITANSAYGSTQNITDDGAGNLIGDGGGTVDYETGEIFVVFNNPVPEGEFIQTQYNPAKLAIPLGIMWYQNQFTLRPVPDKGYTVELTAYRQPSQALLGSTDPDAPNLAGMPEQNEWWECLAFGAAKKVYEDRLDPDGVALMGNGLQERYAIAEVRTYAQIGKAQISTMFSDQLQQSYGSNAFGFGNIGV